MDYILFGAGEYGRRSITLLGKENIKMIFDNNPKKWDSFLEEIPVRNFYDEKDLLSDERIVVAVSPEKAEDIIKQLEDNGVTDYMDYEELVRQVTKEKIMSRPDYIGIYRKAISWKE